MHPHYDVIEYDIKYAENIKKPKQMGDFHLAIFGFVRTFNTI